MSWISNLFSTISSAALSFFAAIIVGLLTLCGVLFSQIAPRQKNINDALALFLTELQKDRAQYIVRCEELEEDLKRERGRNVQIEGELRNSVQLVDSLRSRLDDYSRHKKFTELSYSSSGAEASGDTGGGDI